MLYPPLSTGSAFEFTLSQACVPKQQCCELRQREHSDADLASQAESLAIATALYSFQVVCKLFADRAHPKLFRTLRSASHPRGLAMPVEDGLNDFSP